MKTRIHHGTIDRDRIADDWQIEYWALKLGKSQDDIEDAIDVVGDRASDVRQYFFCGPPAPAAKARQTASVAKVKNQKPVRPPIFDWLCSPGPFGLAMSRNS